MPDVELAGLVLEQVLRSYLLCIHDKIVRLAHDDCLSLEYHTQDIHSRYRS